MTKERSSGGDDLFFDSIVESYMIFNRRFVRRDWLSADLDLKLAEADTRFVLILAEPGAGKSAFVAQLAHDHPTWLRYFIRRDQHAVLSDTSAKSLLLRIGYQLAARCSNLFNAEELKLSVSQNIGKAEAGSEVVGAKVKRLVSSPFFKRVVQIQQNVQKNRGKLVGIRIEELIVETRLLTTEDLLDLSVVHPAHALASKDPAQRLVILIDALDEIRYHAVADDILTWLSNCPNLPPNIRFVVTSRNEGETLRQFKAKQSEHLRDLVISEEDPRVEDDVTHFVNNLVNEPTLKKILYDVEGGTEGFAWKAATKASGNIGYVDALARGIDRAVVEVKSNDSEVAARGRHVLETLIKVEELPAHLYGLYRLFLRQIKASVERVRIEMIDRESAEIYEKPAWPAVFMPILSILAVAEEPIDAALIFRLSGIRAESYWLQDAIDRLQQFLEVRDGYYRFYHASVAEFLTSSRVLDTADSPGPFIDGRKWHARIGDFYWNHYSAHWEQCDDYGLRTLAIHLFKGGSAERLYALMTPRWMVARTSAANGSYQGFLDDLHLVSEELKNRSRNEDNPPDLLAKALRFALIHSVIQVVSGAYPSGLVAEAVRRGLWSPEKAMLVAEQIPDALERVFMHARLLSAGILPEALRHDAIERGVASAEIEASNHADADPKLADAVMALVPFLDRQNQLDRAWQAVGKILGRFNERTAPVKAALAIRFTKDRRREALSEALDDAMNPEDRYHPEPFRILAPCLTGRLLTRALRKGSAIPYVIEGVGPLAPDNVLPRLIKLTRTIGSPRQRAQALASFSSQLPRNERVQLWKGLLEDTDDDDLCYIVDVIDEALLDQTLAMAISLSDEDDRGSALAALAPRLNADAAEEAFAAACEISDLPLRWTIFAALAPRLQGRSREQAIDAVLRTGEANVRRMAEAIRSLLPLLSADQVQLAYTRALAELDESKRDRLLLALLPRLPTEAALSCAPVLHQIEEDAAFYWSSQARDEFIALVEQLPSQTRKALLAPLWSAAMSFGPDEQDATIRAMAPYLLDDTLVKALRDAVTIGNNDEFGRLRTAVSDVVALKHDGSKRSVQSEEIAANTDDGIGSRVSDEMISAALDSMQQQNATSWGSADSELKRACPIRNRRTS